MRDTHDVRSVPDDPLAAVVALGPQIAESAAESERGRRISSSLLQAMRNAGLFRMGLPHEVGGSATDLPTMLAAFEEVARHDGSTGWVAMIGSGTNLILTVLPPDVVREVFSSDPDIATGGTWLPRGRAVREDGGYWVSGRWPFGSGCEHCGWLIGGCVVIENGEPVLDENGRPDVRVMVFPQDQVAIHDTWSVMGLRGTGSHDYEVENLYVPEEYSFDIRRDRSEFSFPYARMPLFGTLGTCLAAALLGIARGAIDALIEHAHSRRVGGELVGDRPLIRARVAQAEGLVRSARAFVFEAAERAWDMAVAEEPIPAEDDVILRLASSHAARACTDAVHLMFTAGGTDVLYDASPLQRFQRDILAAQQHGMVAFYSFEGLGGALLDAAKQTEAGTAQRSLG